MFADQFEEELSVQGFTIRRDSFTDASQFRSLAIQTTNLTADDLINYNSSQGSVDRDIIGDDVIDVAAGAPGYAHVYFHNEQGYTDNPPHYIAFGCFAPALEGGTTLLSSSLQFTNDLKNHNNGLIYNRLLNEGVLYIRNFYDENRSSFVNNQNCLWRSWQQYFGCDDIDTILNNSATTTTRLSENKNINDMGFGETQISYDSETGMVRKEFKRKVFHNDIIIHSTVDMHCRYWSQFEECLELDSMSGPTHCKWGNGDEFTKEEISIMDNIYRKNEIPVDLNKGDMVVVNNLKFVHGRTKFKNGPIELNQVRKIGSLMLKSIKRM